MSIKYVKVQVKSREDIKSTLKDIDTIGTDTHATYGKINLKITEHLWGVCGSVINVRSTKRESHEYDYAHLYEKETEDGTKYFPYIYFMEDWLDPVEEEDNV